MESELINYPDYRSAIPENIFGYNEYHPIKSITRDLHLVTLETGEDGMVIAKCPEINVITQGKTFEDAEKNIVEAINLMREELEKDKEFSISVRTIF